jgi:cyclophilin family peptidyl-prolyl cis-trans isomerase
VKFHPEGRSRLLVVAVLALALASCGEREGQGNGAEPGAAGPVVEVPAATSPRDAAVLVVDDFGEVRIELLADLAPQSVAHFVSLAERDYYDGTTFHRVVPGFVIQGGDPNTRDRDPRNDGTGGMEERVVDERPDLSLLRGLVGLANRGVPDSGGAQFFVVVADAREIDGQYALFGRATEGLDVVDRIAAVERDLYGRHGPIDRPIQNVVIRDVRIERAATDPAWRADPGPVP